MNTTCSSGTAQQLPKHEYEFYPISNLLRFQPVLHVKKVVLCMKRCFPHLLNFIRGCSSFSFRFSFSSSSSSPAPDGSGHCRTSTASCNCQFTIATASSRSQRVLPDLNRRLPDRSVHRRTYRRCPDRSGHRQTSKARQDAG